MIKLIVIVTLVLAVILILLLFITWLYSKVKYTKNEEDYIKDNVLYHKVTETTSLMIGNTTMNKSREYLKSTTTTSTTTNYNINNG